MMQKSNDLHHDVFYNSSEEDFQSYIKIEKLTIRQPKYVIRQTQTTHIERGFVKPFKNDLKESFDDAVVKGLAQVKLFFSKISAEKLDNVIQMSFLQACKKGENEIIKWLCDEYHLTKDKLNEIYNPKRYNGLHQAAYYGHYKTVELLLSYGVNPDFVNETGETPLQACQYSLKQAKQALHKRVPLDNKTLKETEIYQNYLERCIQVFEKNPKPIENPQKVFHEILSKVVVKSLNIFAERLIKTINVKEDYDLLFNELINMVKSNHAKFTIVSVQDFNEVYAMLLERLMQEKKESQKILEKMMVNLLTDKIKEINNFGQNDADEVKISDKERSKLINYSLFFGYLFLHHVMTDKVFRMMTKKFMENVTTHNIESLGKMLLALTLFRNKMDKMQLETIIIVVKEFMECLDDESRNLSKLESFHKVLLINIFSSYEKEMKTTSILQKLKI